jgi:hypothetical protein
MMKGRLMNVLFSKFLARLRFIFFENSKKGLPLTKTHDYTRRDWGHDYTIREVLDDGQRLKAAGWGVGLREGDYIIFAHKGDTTRYQITAVRYEVDPSDMWWADLSFAPREDT